MGHRAAGAAASVGGRKDAARFAPWAILRAVAAKKRELTTEVTTAMIDAAEALVREKRSMPRARLPGWKQLAPAAQAELVRALLARGLEAGDKGALRVPLGEQVAALARDGARPALALARKRLAGAGPKDKDAALAEACKEGRAHLVVRTKVETLVGAGEDVLAADDVDALLKAHAALGAVVKLLAKKGAGKSPLARVKRTLLREDAAALLAPFARWIAGAAGAEEPSIEALLDQIRSLEQPPIALVWIPDLVRGLPPGTSAEAAHRALFEARRRGLVELRPESGVGRLSPDDAALCPAGADGVPLSHVRLLSPA